MSILSRSTIETILRALPSFDFPAADLDALTTPRGGAITGLAELLEDLETLRRIDLGETPPAAGRFLPEIGSHPVEGPEFALCRAYRSGEADPVDHVERTLARIAAQDAEVKAFITVTVDAARKSAVAAQRRYREGRPRTLEGVPFAIKDLIRATGTATTLGARDRPAADRADAACVAALRRAGAILVGKTNLHERAYSATGENPTYGTPANPYHSKRLAGGSSSGSAVAVARGMAAFALGTDTGGSVRVPAALCGLVGLKPTFGLVSRQGVAPFCWSLDHIGVLAHRAADAAAILGAIVGHDPSDPASVAPDGLALDRVGQADIDGLRVGICRGWAETSAEAHAVKGLLSAASDLEEAGATLSEVTLPDFSHVRTVSLVLQLAEAVSHMGRRVETAPDSIGQDIRGGLLTGQLLLAEHYVRARRMSNIYGRQMDEVLSRVDVLLTPTVPVEAPLIGEPWVEVHGRRQPVGNVLTHFTTLFNITGHPAVTVPIGLAPGGLPLGVQIIGRRLEDHVPILAAMAIQNASTGRWHPPMQSPAL